MKKLQELQSKKDSKVNLNTPIDTMASEPSTPINPNNYMEVSNLDPFTVPYDHTMTIDDLQPGQVVFNRGEDCYFRGFDENDSNSCFISVSDNPAAYRFSVLKSEISLAPPKQLMPPS